MKRFAVATTLAAVASLSVLAAPANAASICLEYDININGQGQAGAQCLPG